MLRARVAAGELRHDLRQIVAAVELQRIHAAMADYVEMKGGLGPRTPERVRCAVRVALLLRVADVGDVCSVEGIGSNSAQTSTTSSA